MNETIKSIMERNSCRDFKDTPLTEEQLKTIVDAALAAPSAMNRQPWHVVVVKDKAIVDELDAAGIDVITKNNPEALERMKERGGKIFYNAPCVIYVLSDGSAYGSMDSGILTQNVCIAAQSMGLSTCIVGMANMPLTGEKGDEYKKMLKFPEGYEFAIGILLGTPNTGKEPHELVPEKVTYIG
ncbi:MAG: nitroreductase [Oscillospiraceae bacterium]|nr:nitroreductase [Oscillospiraceae bacterium]